LGEKLFCLESVEHPRARKGNNGSSFRKTSGLGKQGGGKTTQKRGDFSFQVPARENTKRERIKWHVGVRKKVTERY